MTQSERGDTTSYCLPEVINEPEQPKRDAFVPGTSLSKLKSGLEKNQELIPTIVEEGHDCPSQVFQEGLKKNCGSEGHHQDPSDEGFLFYVGRPRKSW